MLNRTWWNRIGRGDDSSTKNPWWSYERSIRRWEHERKCYFHLKNSGALFTTLHFRFNLSYLFLVFPWWGSKPRIFLFIFPYFAAELLQTPNFSLHLINGLNELQCLSLSSLSNLMYSSFLGSFVTYEENQVLWIQLTNTLLSHKMLVASILSTLISMWFWSLSISNCPSLSFVYRIYTSKPSFVEQCNQCRLENNFICSIHLCILLEQYFKRHPTMKFNKTPSAKYILL